MRILLVAVIAWFLAQLNKVVTNLIVMKKFEPRLFFASGGMPSSHSAFISSVATGLGLSNGFNSDIFILALAMTFIVTYDAMNVRRSVGVQGEIINRMIEYAQEEDDSFEIKTLKLVLGHTPLQVLMGLVLGIAVCLISYYFNIF